MSKAIDINPILDELIRETGLNQDEIAERINYDRSYLSQARSAGTKKLMDKLVSFQSEFRKSNNPTLDYKEKTIALLEKHVALLEQQLAEKTQTVQGLQIKVDASLIELQKQAMINRAYLKTIIQVQARILAAQKNSKTPEKIQSEINILLGEALTGAS